MADYRNSFRRNSSSSSREAREDPRLSRRDSNSGKSTSNSTTPSKERNNWQSGQYPMQTSYQHLQGAVYSDPNQYASQGYQNAYAGYQNYSATYNAYEGYGQTQPSSYIPAATVQPGPPGDEYPQGSWAPVGGSYASNQQSASASENKTNQADSKIDGIAQERKQQKAELMKQRDEYNKRASVLRKELDLLRRQKQELVQEHSSDRNTEMILRENGKLQVEIQNKLKDAYNVIEILSGIIGDEKKGSSKKGGDVDDDDSPKRESSLKRSLDEGGKYNYVHYDPELHWCRMCDLFPKTAKDLLVHMQSKEHRDMIQEDEIPWHKLPPEPEFPHVEGASKKRVPIKGLQFFVSTTAWYCRLCDSWIGDLHCASQHLKSIKHSQNYSNFVEQNPHWEIEWLKDREKALDRVNRHGRSSDSDDAKKKKRKKDKYSSPTSGAKDKRKKKRSKKRRKDSSDSSSSSSSSSSSEDDDKKDTSKSIHVAMRNKMKLQAQMIMNEELSGKWEAIGRMVEERKKKEVEHQKETENEDSMINQWMTVKQQPLDKDKALLSSLKDRMKQKQEVEKLKNAEVERKRLEKEKLEREMREKLEREMREREDSKRKEREDLERLKEIREQVKFKTTKDKYRRRRSESKSPERKSRSPSYERRRKTPERYRRHDNGRRSTEYEDSRYKRKEEKKPPPPPPAYKKLPFIGRMPLFKNKKPEDRNPDAKEIKKEEYDIPRQTRFQPGNLARAYIPEPEVVCFPRLSSYPEILAPPPPAPKIVQEPPAPPKISEPMPKAPPPPKINDPVKPKEEAKVEKKDKNDTMVDMVMDDDNTVNNYHDPGFDNSYSNYEYMLYQPPVFDFTEDVAVETDKVPLAHTMPLEPPPLPPDDPNDDLAMLGISSDDLAVRNFK